MKNNILKFFATSLIALAVLLFGFRTSLPAASAEVQAQTPSTTSGDRTVTVSGTGEVTATPDTAVVTLGVTTQAESAADALSQNNTKMQSLISALKSNGVAAKDIQTSSIQLYPVYKSNSSPNSQPTITGYQATNLVTVTIHDLANLGTLLDLSVQAGGNTIQGISFEVSDQTALLEDARKAAVADAQDKAQQLATLTGATLGNVLTIQETSGQPSPVVFRESVAMSAAPVPIETGTQTIQLQVQITWALQ
jgi:uncharacterized protein YggE